MNRLRAFVGRGLVALAAAMAAGAQEIIVEEDFSTDPAERWSLNARGGAGPYWDQGQARVVLTGQGTFEGGAMILREPVDVQDLRIEAKIKLCCGSGADGMAISLFEGLDPLVIGEPGGGLCVAGLTTGPHLLVEFDTWGNLPECEACPNDMEQGTGGNHVAVSYAPMGFPAGDCVPGMAGTTAVCAGSAELGFDLFAGCAIDAVIEVSAGGFVTVDIGADDCGIALHRVIEAELPDFTPFTGLVGITAATGGYTGEHSIQMVRVLGAGGGQGCRVHPVEVTRDITAYGTVPVGGVPTEAYEEGTDLDVVLRLGNVRVAAGECAAAGDVTITETLPAQWTASDISGGGTFADGQVLWSLRGSDLESLNELAYTARGPASMPIMTIDGTAVEPGTGIQGHVRGERTFRTPASRDADGFILSWLLLGAFMQAGGAAPPVDAMRLDYLADGASIDEAGVMPRAGDEVDTDYNGAAASTGLAPSMGGLNPTGLPQWYAWQDSQEVIKLSSPSLYGSASEVAAYGVCYLHVESDIEAVVACGSDDAIQVLVDDVEVWINSVARGWDSGWPLDISPPLWLGAGTHRLMVKVFQGGGEWAFGLRLQDPAGMPLFDGVRVSLDPDGEAAPPPVKFKRGDVNADGGVNIADAVTLLGYLFSMKPPPTCLLTADANDDTSLNIADAVAILNHLFSNRGPLPEPFAACGTDREPGPLTCVSFAPCAGR